MTFTRYRQLLPLVLLSGLMSSVSFALGQDLEALYRRGMAAYSAGNYRQAASDLGEFATTNPRDARVQYYLANSYIELGDITRAVSCYERACADTSDPDLKARCRTALTAWQGRVAPQSTNGSGSAGPTKASGNGLLQAPVAQINSQLESSRAQVIKQSTDRIASIKECYDRQVQAVNDRLAQDLADLPAGYYSGSRGSSARSIDSPSSLKAAATRQIKILTDNYNKNIAAARSDADRRLADLTGAGNNLTTSYAMQSNGSRPVSPGSGFYVRNFLNQSGIDDTALQTIPVHSAASPPSALSAVAQPLSRDSMPGKSHFIPGAK